jgi:copper chaperone NosL
VTLLVALLPCSPDPDAPPTVRFDLDACTDCGMLVSDPAYAAALVTKEGQTYLFDDPGCLFHYVVTQAPHVATMWFHDAADDRWLREAEVAFQTGTRSPMGSGLRAVPAGTPGALSLGAASALAVSR